MEKDICVLWVLCDLLILVYHKDALVEEYNTNAINKVLKYVVWSKPEGCIQGCYSHNGTSRLSLSRGER